MSVKHPEFVSVVLGAVAAGIYWYFASGPVGWIILALVGASSYAMLSRSDESQSQADR